LVDSAPPARTGHTTISRYEKRQFSGEIDCYVTVQESGKRLTEITELPLIVQVIKWTVLLPYEEIPPPYKRKTISAVSQSSNGAMDCYVTVKGSINGQ
jgi:hypothetical protein